MENIVAHFPPPRISLNENKKRCQYCTQVAKFHARVVHLHEEVTFLMINGKIKEKVPSKKMHFCLNFFADKPISLALV